MTAIQGMRNGSLGATILATAAAQLAQRTLAVPTNTRFNCQRTGKEPPDRGRWAGWCCSNEGMEAAWDACLGLWVHKYHTGE